MAQASRLRSFPRQLPLARRLRHQNRHTQNQLDPPLAEAYAARDNNFIRDGFRPCRVDVNNNIRQNMNPPYYDTMHSGNRCIVLEGGIDYDSFAAAAERWARTLDLRIGKRADVPDARVWECEKEGRKFWLAYDNWFPTISLEPQDATAGAEIPSIGARIGAKEKNI